MDILCFSSPITGAKIKTEREKYGLQECAGGVVGKPSKSGLVFHAKNTRQGHSGCLALANVSGTLVRESATAIEGLQETVQAPFQLFVGKGSSVFLRECLQRPVEGDESY